MSRKSIPSDGNESSGDKNRDKRRNYTDKADQYQDKKYGPHGVKREADTRKPPA